MWHCVLDRQTRLVYLGRDDAEARRLAGDDGVRRSASTMGDAMRDAAIASATERRSALRALDDIALESIVRRRIVQFGTTLIDPR